MSLVAAPFCIIAWTDGQAGGAAAGNERGRDDDRWSKTASAETAVSFLTSVGQTDTALRPGSRLEVTHLPEFIDLGALVRHVP